jgi:hypothetical protein
MSKDYNLTTTINIFFLVQSNMKKADDHEISFTSVSGWRVSKKLGTLLAVTCAVTCVAVGLIVYYVGVAKLECRRYDDRIENGIEPTQPPTQPDHTGITSKGLKVIVKQNFL